MRLSSFEASSCGQNNHKESNTRDTWFYPVVRPSNTCLLPRCGVPMDEGCTQPLSSDPKIHLNTTVVFFLILFPVCEESPQLGVSRPYTLMFTKKHGVREEWATHTRHKIRATIRTQVTTRALNTTQRVLYSNGALVAITKNRMRGIEVLVFRNA